jgi:hypothetical protein
VVQTQIALTSPTDLVEWGIKLSGIKIRIKIAYLGGGGRLLEIFFTPGSKLRRSERTSNRGAWSILTPAH